MVRVSGAPTVSAAAMGARGAGFSRAQGERTAANLRNLGIAVDLAPVLDVARPGGVVAATERGFGDSAATENTDFAVQRIGLSKDAPRRIDEAPYRAFAAAGGDLVMLSTAIYPAFSPLPAAFARPIASGELRGRLGFDGVSITDALETVAVRSFGGPRRAGVAAARAGTDLLLFADPGEAAEARRALIARLRAGSLDRAEFEASAQRVLELRRRLAGAAGP